jgi:hypothetical protein
MSICSDVDITRDEAGKRVKAILLREQEILIDLAIKAMRDFDLTSRLNSDMYFYNIQKTKKVKDE